MNVLVHADMVLKKASRKILNFRKSENWNFRFWEFSDFEKYFEIFSRRKNFSEFFFLGPNFFFCRSWEIFYSIASMQKFMIFWFMMFSERFRYSCSEFGVVSFYFPLFFPTISLLGLAASGAKSHFEIQKFSKNKNFVARKIT